MLTIFSTPKPFRGHIGIIQRNALKSWTLLHPDVEILLFGDDEGSAEAARDLGIRHEPEVRKAEGGTKYLDYLFGRAQQIAQHDVLCYVNCDIILLSDFRKAVEQVAFQKRPFLMIGKRWDTGIVEPLDYARSDWEEGLLRIVSERGMQQSPSYCDYFVFSRGLYQEIPPLVIGRVWWDGWLIWKARASKALVVDASPVVLAVHQNHDYSYHPAGAIGVWEDDQARRNYKLAGGRWHICNIDDATHKLNSLGYQANRGRFIAVVPSLRALRFSWRSIWFGFLRVSRRIRHYLGLRQGVLANLSNRVRSFAGRR